MTLGGSSRRSPTACFARACSLGIAMLVASRPLPGMPEPRAPAAEREVGHGLDHPRAGRSQEALGVVEALATLRQGSRSAVSSRVSASVAALAQLTGEAAGFVEAVVRPSQILFELQCWAETVDWLKQAIQIEPNRVAACCRPGLRLTTRLENGL